jgi:hypothetical protein
MQLEELQYNRMHRFSDREKDLIEMWLWSMRTAPPKGLGWRQDQIREYIRPLLDRLLDQNRPRLAEEPAPKLDEW